MKLPEKFLKEWFGVEGRELGKPERFFTRNLEDLLALIKKCSETFRPCYMSVQPYSDLDKPCAIEKLFFDFDCQENLSSAWKDVLKFSEVLKKYYGVEPFIVFSGCKGFHVYVYMDKLVCFDHGQLALAKQIYGELQSRLLKGLNLKTLDVSVIGDIKRLSRVLFSVHEKTGSLCCPITLDCKPYTPQSLDVYKTLSSELLSTIIKELRTHEKLTSLKFKRASNFAKPSIEGIRPCMEEALKQPLEGPSGHLMRLAVAREYLEAGFTVDEIIPLFKNQLDYNPKKTRRYLEYALKNPAKPFKCRTIQRLGYCLETSCPNRKVKNH